MSDRKKRKQSFSTNEVNAKCNRKTGPNFCIVHQVWKNASYEDFVPLSNCKISADEKLQKLQSIKEKRQQEIPANFRMDDACKSIPESLEGWNLGTTGYHRCCYQRFTKNLDRLTVVGQGDRYVNKHRSPRIIPSTSGGPLFEPECIYCNKEEKRVKDKSREKCIQFEKDNQSWKEISKQAFTLGNNALYRLVQGLDLVARKANFHFSCHKDFQLKYFNFMKKSSASISDQDVINDMFNFVNTSVIREKKVVPLSLAKDAYINQMHRNGLEKIAVKNRKIKTLLTGAFGDSIGFLKLEPRGYYAKSLLYNTSMAVDEAITAGWKLSSSEKTCEVAMNLRESIKQAFNKAEPLPWPPTPEDLEQQIPDEILPQSMISFLTTLIDGKEQSNERNTRIVLSLCQDICRAVTSGDWKLSKHILLSMTIRHLFRSKVLTTILSRLGHAENYHFSLELETALANASIESNSKIQQGITTGEANKVFHVEWDNLNKITTNICGSNVINHTAGIMIQELKPEYLIDNTRRLSVYKRSETSTNTAEHVTLAPMLLYNRQGPKFPKGSVFPKSHENSACFYLAISEYRVWVFARGISSNGKQVVPSIGGFISSTAGVAPSRKSTIEYFDPIMQPFTEYAVIEELLARSEAATHEVGQEYVLSTFDLGGCMKALPLVWKYPERYQKHVITPGAFHTAMNYIGMITNRKCAGSGYAEILLESGLVTSGCINNVLKGKAYAKALFCMKATTEALERLLFEVFLEQNSVELIPETLMNLINDQNRETLETVLNDSSTMDIIAKYAEFENNVRVGLLGKTATFWVTFIDHCRLVLMLLFSVKTNNLPLFHYCNGKMAELFFAYDGPNYSRYLTWYEVFLSNIDVTHPGAKVLLESGGIAVTRSLIPGSCSAVDKTMEETFMKFAKSAGGLSGIFSMFGAYQRWCRTTSTRARFYENMLDVCGLVEDPDAPRAGRHRELDTAEIQKSEEAVIKVITAINNFTNPFKIADKDRLYSLASGAPVSQEAEADVLRAEEVGKIQKAVFIEERLSQTASKNFFDPIPRNKLKTMEAANKIVKLTAPQGKVIQYQEQSNVAFMILVKSQTLREPVDLQVLMAFPLTPVPHSLGTPDGYFNKTNKATLMNTLLQDVTFTEGPSQSDKVLHIQDGNALFHQLTNLDHTFGGICLQILDIMVQKKNFIFSTDSYFVESIKGQERLRRGMSPTFHVDGPATRKPAEFKAFLSNDSNKVQLCNLLLKVWSSDAAISRLKKCQTAILVVSGRAYKLRAESNKVDTQEIFELCSNQEETDTRVILYLKYAERLGFQSAVVRTPDTDIFFICLHHASALQLTVYADIGTGKQRKVVDISELADTYGTEYCTTLLGFHVFTGEDVTSAFKGKGKVLPLRKLQENPKYCNPFRRLGNTWIVTDEIIQSLEAFVCLMYGCGREKNVNKARFLLLKKMIGADETISVKSKVELYRLPPCQDNLSQHVKRVNYRVAIFKRADNPFVECPKPYEDDQGWYRTEQHLVEPIWAKGPVLPSSMVEIAESAMNEIEDDVEIDNDDFDDLELSDDE